MERMSHPDLAGRPPVRDLGVITLLIMVVAPDLKASSTQQTEVALDGAL
jgi:hypothetical protein